MRARVLPWPKTEVSTKFSVTASGVAFIYEYSIPGPGSTTVVNLGTAYFSISLSLNLLLTLMIVTRLTLHHMNLRRAIGNSDKTSGLYTTLATMIVESYALFAVAFLSYIVPWAMGSDLLYIFSSFVGSTQVSTGFSFPSGPRDFYPTITTHRSSLPIFSFCESPNGER